MRPLPLLVLSGFLGSGKTSVLKHWLNQTSYPLKKTAVLINDFGEVNVDATLLVQRELALSTITGGCACCQSWGEMVEKVSALSQRPEIELAWIETSGLADPEEIVDHLTCAELHDRAILRRLILLIDGTDYPCSWRGRVIQEEQIRYANLILLTKTDLISEQEQLRIETSLRLLNPHALLVPIQHGQIDPAILSQEVSLPSAGNAGHHHSHSDHEHGHHQHDLLHSASTFFLPLSHALSRNGFTQFLKHLPPAVFRAKGFVQFSETPGQTFVFQQVRNQSEVLLLPVEKENPGLLGVVFIGPQLPEEPIRHLARQWLV